MYKNLREYITALEQAGELVRITTPVDSQLEICELTDRESKRPGGGPAVRTNRNSISGSDQHDGGRSTYGDGFRRGVAG